MIQLLTVILQVAVGILGYLKTKELIDAGKAQQIKENLDASLALIKTGKDAGDKAVADFDARGGVPDPNDPDIRRD